MINKLISKQVSITIGTLALQSRSENPFCVNHPTKTLKQSLNCTSNTFYLLKIAPASKKGKKMLQQVRKQKKIASASEKKKKLLQRGRKKITEGGKKNKNKKNVTTPTRPPWISNGASLTIRDSSTWLQHSLYSYTVYMCST